MGILNVTPDSFSDSGCFFEAERAIDRGLQMVAEGAEILDVGGESTRPGADPVDEDEELRRVLPVIERLAHLTRVPISVDTRKPEVARRSVEAGASIINDIEACRSDSKMWEIAGAAGAGYIAMHMQGTPKTMQSSPKYTDVVEEVSAFLAGRVVRLTGCGMERESIVVDPGIGFGKSPEHNLDLLARLDAFKRIERPVMIGLSKKSFLGRFGGAANRLGSGIACTLWAAQQGAGIFRTHDVGPTVQALRAWEHMTSRTA
jgi:dihydropteroate synthase